MEGENCVYLWLISHSSFRGWPGSSGLGWTAPLHSGVKSRVLLLWIKARKSKQTTLTLRLVFPFLKGLVINNKTLIRLFLWEWVEKRNPWKQEQVFVQLLYKYLHVRTIKLSIFNLTPHVCHATPSKERSPTQSPSYLQHQLHHSHQTTHLPLPLL